MSEDDYESGIAPDGLPIEANAAANGGPVPMEGVLA